MTLAGGKAHCVFKGETKTACGIKLAYATKIVSDLDSASIDKCGNCDYFWRLRAKETSKPKKPKVARISDYKPRHTIKDWEKE